MTLLSAPDAADFDDHVVRLLRVHAGRSGPAVQGVFDQWRDSRDADGGTFLEYLAERGVVNRVAARGIVLSWQGTLDDRDMRQLLDPAAVARAVAKLGSESLARTPMPVEHLRPIGARLGRYVVKGVLGCGGFGPVYLGVHPTLRVPVALKPAPGAAAALREALRSEARLQAALNHPNIVRVWDYDDGDEPFLVLDYVSGENLAERLSVGPLDPRDAFAMVAQMALALRAAARAGVTHGDVKPANILLTPENGFKLADFGLARCRRKFPRVAPVGEPRPPCAYGSWNYMAPEQYENAHDFRSDVYSLGMTLHHALTGEVPFGDDGPDEVMLRHKRGDLEPLHHRIPGLRREVSDLVRRMTATDPGRRFTNHDELVRAAEAAFGLRLDLY